TDYGTARRLAKEQKKDLLIHFWDHGSLDAALSHPDVRSRLANFVCLQLPSNYTVNGQRLLDHAALTEMNGRHGLSVVSLRNPDSPHPDLVISAHPQGGSHYHRVPAYGPHQAATNPNPPPH